MGSYHTETVPVKRVLSNNVLEGGATFIALRVMEFAIYRSKVSER